jgi:hypothetical protein
VLGLNVLAIAMVNTPDATPQPSPPQSERLVAGAVGGLVRVGLAGNVSTSPDVQLYAARGEYEPFQVVVDAQTGFGESLNVAPSDLRSGENVISRSNLPVFSERYVRVQRGSPDFGGTNRPLGKGLYPDALVPLIHGMAESGSSRSPDNAHRAVFWIDVYVPRQAQPGLYHGAVTVSSRSDTATIPVSLVVWRHTLPLRPSLKSSFGIHHSRIRDRRIAELLFAHRLMPFLIDPARSVDYRDRFGINATGLWFFGDANLRTWTMNPAPPVAAVRDAMARYPGDVEKYVYAADEIGRYPQIFPIVKEWARNVHAGGAKMLVTVAPTADLLDDGSGTGRSAVDIWVLLPKMERSARTLVRQVLQKGDEVWSYNCLVQDPDSPKWEIDFSPINYRIQPGFLNQSLGMTGLLYWQVDNWKKDPWEDAGSFEEGGYTFPGEGMLVYPSSVDGADGPVPSMRLKWLRKGVEDYEYVEMLKRAGRGAWALDVVREVASDWNSWTHDPATLEGARRKLGEELDRLEGEKRPRRFHTSEPSRGPETLYRRRCDSRRHDACDAYLVG